MNLWGYLPTIYRNAKLNFGYPPTTKDWKLDRDWYAKGFAPDDAGAVKGIHGQNDLIIIDDAQSVRKDIINADISACS